MKTNVNKTNVSIKFSSIEEYREIEKKLEELGYVNDKEWNESLISDYEEYKDITHHVYIHPDHEFSVQCSHEITYNSLEEFLNDE